MHLLEDEPVLGERKTSEAMEVLSSGGFVFTPMEEMINAILLVATTVQLPMLVGSGHIFYALRY